MDLNKNYLSQNKDELIKLNNEIKDRTGFIKDVLKLKLVSELEEDDIDFIYLKMHINLDLFETCDCFFTGLFKFNNEIYEVVFNEDKNAVVLLNKNNKKDFTEYYKRKCFEINNIGELIYFNRLNNLLIRKQRLVDKTEALPTNQIN